MGLGTNMFLQMLHVQFQKEENDAFVVRAELQVAPLALPTNELREVIAYHSNWDHSFHDTMIGKERWRVQHHLRQCQA